MGSPEGNEDLSLRIADKLGCIVAAGQSAGGGLAAAVALAARDRKEPALYPMLDHRNITRSSYQINDPREWSRDFNLFAWGKYLVNVSNDVPAYASPAIA